MDTGCMSGSYGSADLKLEGRWGPITLLLCAMALLLGIQNPLLYGMAPGLRFRAAAMGKMWVDGDVLYRDMLDIKGPVIFLLMLSATRWAAFLELRCSKQPCWRGV